jgi:UDP-N-acetylmuramate--alanine ligase
VLDVYPARERREDFPGVTGLLVAQAAADAAAGRPVAWLPSFEQAQALLARRMRDGDMVLTLGAGDVDALGRALVAG